ncbi:hypothetical protein BC628DRAFT_1405090 [Trametes gibbosa]|nr:hypothetical protein BC628DRAFT_1405090 [Trametes gibbosa]
MESCPLPIEVCEAIMDALSYHRISMVLDRREQNRSRIRQRTLCACALTCRAWRARAQHLLRAHPYLANQHSVSLLSASVRAIRDQWTPYVSILRLNGGGGVQRSGHSTTSPSTTKNPDTGISMASTTDLLLCPFPNLHTFYASVITMDFGPRLLRMRPPLFFAISTLLLDRCTFDSVRAMFDVVWACPNVSFLVIVNSHLRKEVLSDEAAVLLASVGCGSRTQCKRLAAAKLWGTPFNTPSIHLRGRAFGLALTRLTLAFRYLETARALTCFLKCAFPALSDIDITLSDISNNFTTPYEPPCLLSILTAALDRPDNLRHITFRGPHDYDATSALDKGPACCQRFVGASSTEGTGSGEDARPLRERLPGLAELVVMLSPQCAGLCEAYIVSVLPGTGNVLKFVQ